MRFDLHCHSTRSDGSDAPEELARRAAAAAVDVFAVTDHDTCTPIDVPGARCLRAVEITCDDAGVTIHMLAYDRGGAWDVLERALDDMRIARRARLQAMAERLAALGIAVDVAPLLAETDRRAVGRPDLARAVVARGHASSMKEAFARYLYDGGPVDLPHRTWPIADAIAVGRAAGAALSLAHPHFYEQRSAELVRRHKADGLTGLEAFYGAYDLARRRRWIEVADDLGATCTGGSDWHGTERPDLATKLGVDFPAKRAEALLRWLEPS
ncbi:MAG: PHP domain-containing protein [Deltaproteobacteria bacterium]|nr:PHP domain-containing protein [Deltaproteobacteria bacterium]MCW5804665.1 PHP domain-containing protein [Deltaproteobacteria bacterium]